jgi:sortase A
MLVIVGIGILAYPLAVNLMYDAQVAAKQQVFLRPGNAMEDAEKARRFEELYRFLKAENERMYTTGQAGLVDAFSYQTVGVNLSDYGIDDGCIGFVEIPAIDIVLPIYLGANAENMRAGAVHLTQTSYPIGGYNTNAVIAAHRGATTAMFKNIHQIRIDDEILITNFREQLVYRAAEIKIIAPSDIDHIKIQEGKDIVTLISCNPLGANYERYILYCERVTEKLRATR